MVLRELGQVLWEMLAGRASGPMNLRLILQPTVATVLAVRAGYKDGRDGKPAFLWTVFTNADSRRDMLKQGWKDVSKVFLVAMALDVIYELVVYRWVFPLQALLVAFVLAIVPYVLIRGPVGRLVALFRSRRAGTRDPE